MKPIGWGLVAGMAAYLSLSPSLDFSERFVSRTKRQAFP